MAPPCAFERTNMGEWARTDMFGDTRSCFCICIHRSWRMSPSSGKWKRVLFFPWLLLDSSVSSCFRLNLLQKCCTSDWKSVTFCLQVLHLLSPGSLSIFQFRKEKIFFPWLFTQGLRSSLSFKITLCLIFIWRVGEFEIFILLYWSHLVFCSLKPLKAK